VIPRRVFVLGGTGFIGGHIARAALANGWEVRALRRKGSQPAADLESSVEWAEGDLDQPAGLAELLQTCDVVFHAAGYYPRRGGSVSQHVVHGVRQIRGVLAAAERAGVRRLVFTSSLTTIGLPAFGDSRLADERDAYLPGSIRRSAYHECKYAMESEVLRAGAGGMPAVVVNPTIVFGPQDPHLVTARLILAVAGGRLPVWMPIMLNVIDARDAAAAHLRAAMSGRSGERYLLGGHNVAMDELLQRVDERLGRRTRRIRLPVGLARWLAAPIGMLPGGAAAANHLHGLHCLQAYSTAKAADELGLQARPLQVTLDDTLGWLRASGHLPAS
jgi:dihydroflavonol-4-reductase